MLPYFTKATFVNALNNLLGRTVPEASVTFAEQAAPSTGFGTTREAERAVSFPSIAGPTQNEKLYYNRMDLATLNTVSIMTTYKVQEGLGVHAILDDLNRITGMPFTVHDLLNDPVTAQASDTSFTQVLRAAPTSPWFKGQFTLTFGRKAALSALFTDSDLGTAPTGTAAETYLRTTINTRAGKTLPQAQYKLTASYKAGDPVEKTQLALIAQASAEYRGTHTLTYNRRSINELSSISLASSAYANWTALVAALVEKGALVTIGDFDTVKSVLTASSARLVAHANSLTYYAGSVVIGLEPTLAETFTNTSLNGFTPA